MESVWSPLESTSSTFGGVLSARRTPEARSVPKRSVELTLMCMIVNYTPPDLLASKNAKNAGTNTGMAGGTPTLPSATEAASRTARRGRAIGRRGGAVGARWGWRGGRTAAAAELARAVIGVGVLGHRRGVLRIAISARLAGVLGILEAAALGKSAAGIMFLCGRTGGAVLRRLGRGIAPVVGLVALLVSVIILILAVVQRTVVAIEQQVAHQRVLAVEDPEAGTVALFPVAVLVALSLRGHVGETGRLRHALAFGFVLSGGLVFDRHPQVLLHGLVLRFRNVHPFFVGYRVAGLAGGVGDFGAHRLDLLVVRARVAAAAGFHIDEDFVPGFVQLRAQRLELLGLLGQVRRAGLERVRRREEGAEIDLVVIVGCRGAARLGGGLPEIVAAREDAARRGQARIQIVLLLRPVGLRLLCGRRGCRQIHRMDARVIALHVLDFLGQMLLQVDPVGGVLAHVFGIGHGRGADLLLTRQQRFGAVAVASPVLFLQLLQFGERLAGVGKRTGGPAEAVRILARRGQGTEQSALTGKIARDFGPRRLELRFCRGERFAFGRDLGLDRARQTVEAGEEDYEDAGGQQDRQNTQ